MSKSGKKVSKKKVLKIVLISLAVFIVVNLIGAAVGTSTSITHPSRESYEDRKAYVKEKGLWGDFDSYDKQDYQVAGLDGYQLSCTFVSSKETKGTVHNLRPEGTRRERQGFVLDGRLGSSGLELSDR